ncbi:hypothetical protein N9A54_01545 [Porticoccaceae bacterium]|nr:hypothetical protein [Porticoccaceae bacterium]
MLSATPNVAVARQPLLNRRLSRLPLPGSDGALPEGASDSSAGRLAQCQY